MLKEVIEYLNTEIGVLNKFTSVHGITSILTNSETPALSFPAVYKSAGESDHLNFDFHTSTIYHRLTSEVDFEEEEDDEEACSIMRTEVYPMKMVCYFPKDLYKTDSGYAELQVTKNIANLIGNQNISALAADFQLDYISVKVNSIEIRPEEVWNAEYKNVPFKLDSKFALTSIEYEIEIKGVKDCFLNLECGGSYISVKDLLSTVVLDQNGTIIINVLPGNTYQIDIGGGTITYIWATLPASGTDIVDSNGNIVGTWIDESEIFISPLAGKDIDEYIVWTDGTRLKWANADDEINDIDRSLTGGGTIKLFPDRDLFQRDSELFIQI